MQGRLARRYAKAFLEIAQRDGVVDAVGADLLAAAEIVSRSRELQVVLQNPAVPQDARHRILAEILGRVATAPATARFLGVVVDRGRLAILREIALAYQAQADEAAGRVRAEVIAAERLDDERLARLRQALEAMTGKKVVVEHREDPDLLAGVVTRVGSWVYDGSLRTQVNRLRETLLQG